MDPATVAALIDAARAPLGGRRRHRDHARGQSQFGRGGALRRSRRGRRQPPLARPAELRRRRRSPSSAALTRRARAWHALEIAQKHFERVSFDLIYALARRHAKTAGRRRWPRRLALGTDAPVALPADDRARHALRQRWSRKRRVRAARRGRGRGAVRADRRHDVGRRHCPPTRSATTRAPARRAATTSLTGATAIMPASAPARTAAGSACAPSATEAREFPVRAAPQRPRHRRGGSAARRRGRRRGAGHGPAARRRDRRRRIAAALRTARDRRLARVDRLVGSGHLARDGAASR